MTHDPHPWTARLFAAAAVIGMGGWLILLGLWGWWSLQPVTLPTITEPLPVLNEGQKVLIGTALQLQLDVDKSQELVPESSARRLECESGNLVTLTSTVVQLPPGSYEVILDSVVIPAKITPGDVCRAVLTTTYRINPIRTETATWESEPFEVLPPMEGSNG